MEMWYKFYFFLFEIFFIKNTLLEKKQKFKKLKGDLNSELRKNIFEYFALLFILKILF